ncbi:MAG: ATP-binding protein [Lachnospiraceae bacterium]|nr:ATP-binding protein [Lachnospiraceae bacterium]
MLNAIAVYFSHIFENDISKDETERYAYEIESIEPIAEKNKDYENRAPRQKMDRLLRYKEMLTSIIVKSVSLNFNLPVDELKQLFDEGEFILAFYEADRVFEVAIPDHIEKVVLKKQYNIREKPRKEFAKYLSDLRFTELLSKANGNEEKADAISGWFEKLQNLLRRIFEDDTLQLELNEDNFSFMIKEKDREPFDLNSMSDGYAAVLDVVMDLIMRMEFKTNRSFCFDMPGIVLIDEVETHLHIELQKKVLDLLTTIFPNIQFIMTTHSPFILNSISDCVIYDLETRTLVENGLSDVPYSGIVEGYFNSSELSEKLTKKYERYRELVKKPDLTDDDFEEIAALEMYLDEIPDYLAIDFTTEYQRLKLEFEAREDI